MDENVNNIEKDNSEVHLYRPNSCDEYLELIYAIGYDYDGCEKPESLKELIDELIDLSTKARKCLHEGKLFREFKKKEE